jgi:predicted TIM-barrel fold metal-dependent hydrolase
MIVDTHAYVFRAADEPAGHASGNEHLAYWQWGYAVHHQPAFRTRDRVPVPAAAAALLAPTPTDPWARADLDFHADHTTGRLVWSLDGEEYTKHYLPPNALAFTPGQLIGEMDYAGVDWVLNHVDMSLDKGNDYFAAAVRAYPNRIRSMVSIEEWRIADEPEQVAREAADAIATGLHAIKIMPEYAYKMSRVRSFDDPSWRPFWDAVTTIGVPLFFSFGGTPGITDRRSAFINELLTLKRLAARYPETKVSVTHGFPWRAFVNAEETGLDMTDEMWEPFRDSQIHMEVSFPIRIGDLFDYPYRECWPMLAAMVEHIGADRLMWGTDMPFQNRFCTYRQSRDWIEKYAPAYLSADQITAIMGGTAARFLDLPSA